jgi:hypothetical protein
MVVSSTNAVTRFNGNGVTTVFNAPVVGEAGWLVVTLFDNFGNGTLQVLNTDYTYSMSTGQITMSTAPAVGEVLVVQRTTPLTQPAKLEELTELPAATLEGGLDRLTLISQDLSARLDRAVLIPVNEEGVSAEELLENIQTLVPLADELETLASIASDIENLGPLSPDLAQLAAALNAGASPFSNHVVIAGSGPRLSLSDTGTPVAGAERVSLRHNAGTFAVQLRTAADALVGAILQADVNAAGATLIRARIGGAVRLAIDNAGADITGLMKATRASWREPVAAVGDTHSITDCNNIVDSGLYYVEQTALNRPPVAATQGAYVFHLRQYADNYWTQIAFRDAPNQGTMFIRNNLGGSPGAWRSVEGREQTSPVSTASGTQAEFTALPLNVNSFRLLFDRVGVNSSGVHVDVTLRTSPGGPVTSGYVGSTILTRDSAATVGFAITTGIRLSANANGVLRGGMIDFRKLGDGSTWGWSGCVSGSESSRINTTAGVVTGLTNPVSGVRLTAATGAFNGGEFRVEWGG